MRDKYYYYKRTVNPGDCDIYNYSIGVAAYERPSSKGYFLFHGTEQEFQSFWQERKVPRHAVSRPTGAR